MEARYGATRVELACVANFIRLDRTEDNLRILVQAAVVFVPRLELHAWTAIRGPKIDDHRWILTNYFH